MPQQPSRGGEDDCAQDETKIYHTEGEQEEKAIENVPGTRDSFDHLNDIKSSLVNEGESVSSQTKPGSNSQRNNKRSLGSSSDYGDPSKDSRVKKVHGVCEGNKSDQIPRFPPYTNLAIIAGGYHPNGTIVPGAAGSKMPVVHPSGPYPPSLAHLMMYQQEHYGPGTPPPPHLASPLEVDAKTGIPRPRHPDLPLYHPLSPGSLGQVPHHLEVYNMPWQGQPFYPLSSAALRSPYPIVSGANMHLSRPGMPPPHLGMPITGIPHPAIVTPGARQHDAQQQSNDRQKEKETKADRKKKESHIKKPLNAFMLYMKEMRASVVKECTLKESAAINQILGRRWHALSREEQAKYYELARKERQLHMQLYPGWSARDNYAVHGKKKKKKKDKSHGDNSEPSTPKKCRARFGVDQQEYWCKPCRRKKKCIRYVAQDENGEKHDDSGPEDMEQSPPSPDDRSSSPKPSTSHSPSNSMHNSHPVDGHSSHSTSSSSSTTSKQNSTSHPAERSSQSSSQSSSSSHHHTPSMSRPPSLMSQPSSPFTQTSPAIVHIPHASVTHSSHHPVLTTQPPVLVYPSSPMSMFPHLGSPEALRSHHHLANGMPPPGLISSAVPPPQRPPRRNGTTDVPQDLSMKSATVSA